MVYDIEPTTIRLHTHQFGRTSRCDHSAIVGGQLPVRAKQGQIAMKDAEIVVRSHPARHLEKLRQRTLNSFKARQIRVAPIGAQYGPRLVQCEQIAYVAAVECVGERGVHALGRCDVECHDGVSIDVEAGDDGWSGLNSPNGKNRTEHAQ